jgi:hypothetical protein
MMMSNSRLHAGAKALVAGLALAALAAAPASAAVSAPTPAALAAAPASAAVSAPTPAAFGMTAVGSPGSIHLRGTAGRVLHGAVLLRNVSGHPVTVVLQRADIANASNGNANFVTTTISGSGVWLSLSAGHVRLAARSSRRVTYTVSIPAGVTGGSHYAGIVAFNAADLARPAIRGRSKGTSFTIYRISRQALALTIRLPGPLTRSLSLSSVKLSVGSSGAALVLGLLPGGTELTERAQVNLRVLRGTRTIFAYTGGLGQLFPGVGALNFRIPWQGLPTPGIYHVLGTISPEGSAVIKIDQTIAFTTAKAAQLKREMPPVAQAPGSGTPGWMWIALAVAVALLLALSVTVWRLARRPRRALA